MKRTLSSLLLSGIGLAAGLSPGPSSAAPSAPVGYFVVPFATGVDTPTALTFGPDGWLYVTRLGGQIVALRDRDGNGAADTTVTYASGLTWPLGLAHHDGSLFVTSLNRLTRFTDTDGDHQADLTETLVDTIPSGRHWTTGVAVGPDGLLYVGVGSYRSRDVNRHPWQSSVLRFTTGGDFVDIFAGGFRNPYDLAFQADGSLLVTDNGPPPDSTWNCDEAPDELNWVRAGRDYGFPWCFGSGDCADVSAWCAPAPCGNNDCQWQGGCTASMTKPLLELDPHSSSDGLTFGTGFPGFGANDLFIAQYGQIETVSGCHTDFGQKVVLVRLRKIGPNWAADAAADFVTGLNRPLDVTVGPDSALYIADYAAGTIYRVLATQPGGVPDGGGGAVVGRLEVAPNPASREVRLSWEGPVGLVTRLEIYDVAGRRIVSLGELSSVADRRWDLRDSRGRRVAPGLYLARAETLRGAVTGRLIVTE